MCVPKRVASLPGAGSSFREGAPRGGRVSSSGGPLADRRVEGRGHPRGPFRPPIFPSFCSAKKHDEQQTLLTFFFGRAQKKKRK